MTKAKSPLVDSVAFVETAVTYKRIMCVILTDSSSSRIFISKHQPRGWDKGCSHRWAGPAPPGRMSCAPSDMGCASPVEEGEGGAFTRRGWLAPPGMTHVLATGPVGERERERDWTGRRGRARGCSWESRAGARMWAKVITWGQRYALGAEVLTDGSRAGGEERSGAGEAWGRM